MSASDEIKEAIVAHLDCTGVQSKKSDWKRTVKSKLADGTEYRTFHNAVLNRTVSVVGEDEDCLVYEHDQWIYGVRQDTPDDDFNPTGLSVVFEPRDRWLREGHVYDQHQSHLLETFHFLDCSIFDEAMENAFVYFGDNILKLHIMLKKLGFQHDQSLSDFIGDDNRRGYPAKQTPNAPINPPLPPALDPNFVPPAPPAPPAPQPSGPAPTSTNSGSTAVRPVNKMPGQVFAQQQAQMQNQQQAMMNQIAQMAAQLGATGGVTIGNTHIPAAPLMPGMQPLAGVAPLPPSGIFNSPGMQGAIPKMGGNYPELVDLQPAVQAAFIAQRILGHNGLDQANPQWMDKSDVDNILLRHRSMSFDLDIERSNAIWMLYELADDGSGRVLDDYFAMDDDELYDELDSWGILDQMDDQHEVQIVADYQVYPAPYDLPVPQPQNYPSPMGGHGGRPAPMVGPASINARSGSFAPVTPAAPPAVAPAAPPPGNASANIGADSGDKWPEFCKEVWDTYDVNKTNLPLDLNWYDRYRSREAQITGLGYEFVRREFTGIVVKMGYLGRDGELLENIDLPSAVLEELLKEWGGSWNVDDITQEINKRKGENPDTGFSYTSEQLWEEVREYLDQQGWKEAK